MPTATFYPSVSTQPASGEGAFNPNTADATDWNNLAKANKDSDSTSDEGSLTGVNALTPATPPAATDVRLANEFCYTAIALATVFAKSKMARLSTWKRVGDNADISTVIPANATAITALTMSFRFADSSYGIDSVGGSGAAVYTFEAQQRNSSGAIGSTVLNTSLFDYAASSLYCYYVANAVSFGTLPTVAQIRDAAYGVNFILKTSDVLETTPYIGLNGLTVSVTWTEPSEASARIRPSRARSRVIW
jgi:hypothetical protein